MNTKSNGTTAGTQSGRSEEVTPQAGLPGHSPREEDDATGTEEAAVADDATGTEEAAVADEATVVDEAVARRTPTGWRVGGEEVPDLTSAMVLADLLAADLPSDDQWQAPGVAANAPPVAADQATEQGSGAPVADPPAADAEQLKETVAQLERALTVRVRVEQAIGVLAERHRLRPRQAFELLRSASRARGARVSQTAGEVVASVTNPLLRIPEELARQPEGHRGRSPRHPRRRA
jgi:ANTAR domain